MGYFLEHELPILSTILIPIAIFVGIYYTFQRAFRETGGTRAGYIILGLIVIYFGVVTLKDSLAMIRTLF